MSHIVNNHTLSSGAQKQTYLSVDRDDKSGTPVNPVACKDKCLPRKFVDDEKSYTS
jgi:hypothetical protein